ncbi:hypothetical protein [Microbacterium sp. PMB16]|uniref:hypothetical protein n=1 Tax=Microbacterium sp. PMB16 TaxID=3120157 RepID=UPI003F4B971B
MRSTAFALCAALAVVAVLSGCSPVQDPAPSVTGGTSALEDLTIDACPPGSGRLTSRGSLQNSDDSAADFVVRVSWLAPDGAVLASGWDSIDDVAAGDSADWSVPVDLGDVSAASCTAALTRGAL